MSISLSSLRDWFHFLAAYPGLTSGAVLCRRPSTSLRAGFRGWSGGGSGLRASGAKPLQQQIQEQEQHQVQKQRTGVSAPHKINSKIKSNGKIKSNSKIKSNGKVKSNGNFNGSGRGRPLHMNIYIGISAFRGGLVGGWFCLAGPTLRGSVRSGSGFFSGLSWGKEWRLP